VLATGETHTVREFVELSFAHVGTTIRWEGKGIEEKGVDATTGRVLVEIDLRYFRPTEVDFLQGDPAKAKKELGWVHSTGFKDLVADMMQSDLASIERKKGHAE
jgi:GDPmannose 4,6-dehydratase